MDLKKLEAFKKIVLKAMNLKSQEEIEIFEQIPDNIHIDVFRSNFNENIQLSRKIIFNKFDANDYKKIENEKLKINDLKKASVHISKEILNDGHVLFLTDTDNDGSLAQANIIEFEKSLSPEMKKNITTLYCQTINGNSNRGFTVDLVAEWVKRNPEYKDEPFTIVSADNGINSREEQIKINAMFPKVKLIVTDHHLPDEDEVVLENKQTMIVNPKYRTINFFKEKNISGANVLGKLLEVTLNNIEKEAVLENKDTTILNMREISRIANLLDYVDTDISDKPLKDHLIEKYASLGALMNVNNSLNKIITVDIDKEGIKNLFSEIEGLDLEVISEAIMRIKEQNKMASKIITLNHRYNSLDEKTKESLSKDSINRDLIVELNKKDSNLIKNNINPNFVEQLRPHIYNYAADTSLTDYEIGIFSAMEQVYSKLKKEERVLQDAFGKVELLNVEKLENATVMYPKSKDHLSILNRKILGKIYNEENNGILMILDAKEKKRVSGSFRSLYRIQDILKNKDPIEKALGIKLSFLGHDKAAGFFIDSANGADISGKVISDVSKYLSNSIKEIKLTEKRSFTHLIQADFDFTSIDVINKYNKAIKGSLTNMQSLAPVIQFNKSTYLTNSETQVENHLQGLVKEKKYGYVPVELSFHGHTVVLPTEMLRQISNSNFKDGLQISFMNDNVFIGQKVIPNVIENKLTRIKTASNKRAEIESFFKEHYQENGFFTKLDMKYIKDSPFFKYNKFGENEYKRYEATVIDIIEKSNVDMMVVADTEANGLGNAPKVINFGVVELSINKDSGKKMSEKAFDERTFKSQTGKKFLLTSEQVSSLKVISGIEYDMLSFDEKQKILKSLNEKEETKMFLSDSSLNYEEVSNFKILDNGEVIYNRELKADIGSMFINDHDVKVSEKIKTLTAIDNTLLNKIGMTSKKVDEILVERYKDKKCIFQAHNLPYDLGVIKGNFNKFYDIVTDFEGGNLLNDSAIYSREDKLAYDPVGIAVFEKDRVPALSGIQFLHSEHSDLNLKNFLSNDEDGMMPDRTTRYILKKKKGNVSIIDTKEKTEVKVSVFTDGNDLYSVDGNPNGDLTPVDEMSDIEKLRKVILTTEMPKNSIKYSVQALSDYDVLRSLILSSSKFKIKEVDVPESLFAAKSTLQFFMMNYHFDNDFNHNFRNFSKTLKQEDFSDLFVTEGYIKEEAEKLRNEWRQEQIDNPPKRKKKEPNIEEFMKEVPEDPKMKIFKDFAERFLDENKDLSGKLNEVWAYKAVLNLINPVKKDLKDNEKLEIISYQSAISVDKIKSILEEAIEFKEKYQVDHVIQKEPHNNVFFDECDVVMESILTFKRPSDKNYNSYVHSTENVVDMYLKNMVRTTSQHIISQQRKMALDSFSKKQADSYKRSGLTSYIEENQKIDIENVKFKFSASTLPTDTFAYGVLKRELSKEEIKDASKKLEFVARNQQMYNSIGQKIFTEDQEDLLEGLMTILKKNDEKVASIKEEMNELFEKVYFSRKEDESKKVMKLAIDSILTGFLPEVPKTMSPLLKREKDLVVDAVLKFNKIAGDLGVSRIPKITVKEEQIAKKDFLDAFIDSKSDKVVNVDNSLVRFLMDIPEISEKELQEIDSENKLNKKTIIEHVSIKRRDDATQIFKFNELTNKHLSDITLNINDSKIDLSKELKENRMKAEAKAKPKGKAKPKA